MPEDLLGYDEDGLPIWAMFGAEGEDDDTGGEDDTDEEGGEDDETEDEGDPKEKDKGEPRKQPRSAKATKASAYKPPSEKEWQRTQAALKTANDAQRAARKAALEKAKKEGMDEAAVSAREKALEEANTTWKPRVVRTEAKAELLALGCKNPDRLIKLVDQDKVTIQEDGSLLGLEGQLADLKEEWPELFRDDDETPGKKVKKEVPPAKKIGGAAGSGKKDEGGEKKDTRGAARVAERLLGSSA